MDERKVYGISKSRDFVPDVKRGKERILNG